MFDIQEKELLGIRFCHISFLLSSFDLDTIIELEEKLKTKHIICKNSLVIIDIRHVGYLDSSALGVLLRFSQQLTCQKKTMSIVGANHSISMVLKLVEADDTFKKFDTLEEAVTDYGKI